MRSGRAATPGSLGIPLVLAGANEQQTIAALYVLASLIQFGAFVVLLRAVFPDKVLEQALGLLFFLLARSNHSIHHYRDVPVRCWPAPPSFSSLLISSPPFAASRLPSAMPACGLPHSSAGEKVRLCRRPRGESRLHRPGHGAAATGGGWGVVWVFAAMLGSEPNRGADFCRRAGRARAAGVAEAVRAAGSHVRRRGGGGAGSLLLVYRLEGVDPSEASRYQFHTFLDSTPESWLTPALGPTRPKTAAPTTGCCTSVRRSAGWCAAHGRQPPDDDAGQDGPQRLGQPVDPARPEPVDISRRRTVPDCGIGGGASRPATCWRTYRLACGWRWRRSWPKRYCRP